jgi:hypothetical protein
VSACIDRAPTERAVVKVDIADFFFMTAVEKTKMWYYRTNISATLHEYFKIFTVLTATGNT